MNRRELLQSLSRCATAAGIEAESKLIDIEPKLLAVLSTDDLIKPEALACLRDSWEHLWEGHPPFPLVILQGGMKLEVIVDPSKK